MDLACLAPVKQAAALILYLAEKTQKKHFVVECEEILQTNLYINAAELRKNYLTNIKFAVDELFFDSDYNQPLAPKSIWFVFFSFS